MPSAGFSPSFSSSSGPPACDSALQSFNLMHETAKWFHLTWELHCYLINLSASSESDRAVGFKQ